MVGGMSQSAFVRSSDSEKEFLPPEPRGLGIWPWLLIGLAMLAVFLVSLSRKGGRESVGMQHPAVSKRVTQFSLKPLTGGAREIELEDLAGKVTLVNFWGPWCGACAIEFPHLVEIEGHFRGDERFQFLSVSTNFDLLDETGLADSTAEFLKRHQADFPTYKDPRGETTRALVAGLGLENFGYPTTLLIGPDLSVRAVWAGYSPGDEKDVLQMVEKTLAEPAAAEKSGPDGK
jgi:thiol-disulfide isomerase/thioredoxin